MTAYIILRQMDRDGEVSPGAPWVHSGPVEAVSAEAAIRKAVDGDQGGTYVAVPVRSWAPVTVTVETKRTLKIA